MSESIERYLEVAQRMQLLTLGAAPGVVYWQPAGLKLYENLRSYIRTKHQEANYVEVKTPALVNSKLFEQSGHMAKYRENMFIFENGDSEDAPALRPMSCPNHIVLYKSIRRSYRELPLSYFEFGEVFRNEPSGSLQVLFRQRQFCQDDAHVFVTQDQISASVARYLKMSRAVYLELGFVDVQFAVSLRPEQRFGEDSDWDKAEEALRSALKAEGLEWNELPGGGAFYGPKIEMGVRDKLGRVWQMGVIQLDYVLPKRFELQYMGADNGYHTPVLLHHAVLGSLERMIGILLEIHGTHLPDYLHPLPVVVLSLSERSADYAKEVHQHVRKQVRDAVLDISDGPLSAKIAHWKSVGAKKVYVVGPREAKRHAAGEGMWVSDSSQAVLHSVCLKV